MTKDARFTALPTFGVTVDPAWQVVIFDKDGVNQFKHANGCQLTTMQNRLSAGTASDQAETDAQIAAAQKEFTGRAPEAQFKVSADPLPLTLGIAGKDSIDFAALLVRYTNKDTKTEWGSVIAIRAMPKVGSRMIVNLSCPTTAMNAALPVLEKVHVLGS